MRARQVLGERAPDNTGHWDQNWDRRRYRHKSFCANTQILKAILLMASLEGFSPTPEMPEIAEAQALLAALAETDEVKAAETSGSSEFNCTWLMATRSSQRAASARRKRRKPSPSPRSRPIAARMCRAGWRPTSACGPQHLSWRLARDAGARGGLPQRRRARPDSPEAGVAHRAPGSIDWFAGEYREARDRLERALALFQPGRDDDLAFRFGVDPGVSAMAYLAIALWPLGEIDRAVPLVERMRRESQTSPMPTHSRSEECSPPCSN